MAGINRLEAVQEVFRAVATGIGSFKGNASAGFRSWLWGITRNKLADFQRQIANSPAARGGTDAYNRDRMIVAELPEQASEIEQPFDAAGDVLHRTLETIQGEFEPTTWEAFFQVVVGGRPAAEIGKQLGMSKEGRQTGQVPGAASPQD